jgi:hypothetical protein
MSIFLSQDEVAELTGYARGRDGKSRNELQIAQLRSMGIAFFINAAGRPIVAKAVVEGGKASSAKPSAWKSNVLNLEKRA